MAARTPADKWAAEISLGGKRDPVRSEPAAPTRGVDHVLPLFRVDQAIDQRLESEEGQDMIEYALLAALISIVAIAIIILVGPYLKNLFQDVVNGLASA